MKTLIIALQLFCSATVFAQTANWNDSPAKPDWLRNPSAFWRHQYLRQQR